MARSASELRQIPPPSSIGYQPPGPSFTPTSNFIRQSFNTPPPTPQNIIRGSLNGYTSRPQFPYNPILPNTFNGSSGFFGNNHAVNIQNWRPPLQNLQGAPLYNALTPMPYKAHYDASLEQEEGAQEFHEDGAPVGAMSHWFSGLTEAEPPRVPRPGWMESLWSNDPSQRGSFEGYAHNDNMFAPVIDPHMRKKLPAWILEGLEKAEQEKQKKLETDKTEKLKQGQEEERNNKRTEKGLGKFDSDSEEEENGKINDKPSTSFPDLTLDSRKRENNSIVGKKRSYSKYLDDLHKKANEPEHEMTEEERRQQALMAIRKLMTTVLLEATDGELQRVAKESLLYAKRKAQPKLLLQNSSLAALFDDDDEEEDDKNVENKTFKPVDNVSTTEKDSKYIKVSSRYSSSPERSSQRYSKHSRDRHSKSNEYSKEYHSTSRRHKEDNKRKK